MFSADSLLEADEKVDLDQDLTKIYKAIVKGIDTLERASTAMSTSTTATSASKASSPYVVGSNDRYCLQFLFSFNLLQCIIVNLLNKAHQQVTKQQQQQQQQQNSNCANNAVKKFLIYI